jgi:hypothetical protein
MLLHLLIKDGGLLGLANSLHGYGDAIQMAICTTKLAKPFMQAADLKI